MRYEVLDPVFDERSRTFLRRRKCARPGGVAAISPIAGVARSTSNRGLAELRDQTAGDRPARRTRRPGGGRKRLTETMPLSDLRGLVELTTRGDRPGAAALDQPQPAQFG
jgi:hypothetical protein